MDIDSSESILVLHVFLFGMTPYDFPWPPLATPRILFWRHHCWLVSLSWLLIWNEVLHSYQCLHVHWLIKVNQNSSWESTDMLAKLVLTYSCLVKLRSPGHRKNLLHFHSTLTAILRRIPASPLLSTGVSRCKLFTGRPSKKGSLWNRYLDSMLNCIALYHYMSVKLAQTN